MRTAKNGLTPFAGSPASPPASIGDRGRRAGGATRPDQFGVGVHRPVSQSFGHKMGWAGLDWAGLDPSTAVTRGRGGSMHAGAGHGKFLVFFKHCVDTSR